MRLGWSLGRLAKFLQHLDELAIDRGQVVQFIGRGTSQVGQILKRRQEAILNHRRHGHFEIHGPEKLVVAGDVFLRLARAIRRRGGQADHDRLVEQFASVGQHTSPMAQQMVAFVEDHQPAVSVA